MMDKLKILLTLVAIIIVALVVLSAIGFIYSLLYFVLIAGIICLGAVIALRLMRGSDQRQVPGDEPNRQLEKIERILEEYKQK